MCPQNYLRDNNILEVLDARIINKNYACFITPEITGGDLDSFIQKNRVEIHKAIHITKGILKGLTALHHKPSRLVHRDLKPANILINPNHDPFIADFGSIRKIASSEISVKASPHSVIFRPPEAFSSGNYYFNSDLYQVGIILYQLLGGHFPYKDVTWLSKREKKEYALIEDGWERTKYFDTVIKNKVCNDKLLKYDSLPIFVPRRLKNIIKSATNADLEKRYQNTSEFMRDIHEFMSNSTNWRAYPEGIIALKRNVRKFRIIRNKGKYVAQKRYGKVWKNYNRIKGTPKEIVEQINLQCDKKK